MLKTKMAQLCKVCEGEITTNEINAVVIKKLAGKELSEILESVCGTGQIIKLGKCALCKDCALKLVQTEPFLNKVRKAFVEEGTSILECTVDSNTMKSDAKIDDQVDSAKQTFRCSVCEFQCEKPSNMTKHLEIKHNLTNQKIFKCTLCSLSFQNRAGLSRHTSWSHVGRERKFPCPQCKKSFFHEKVLTQHILKHKETTKIKLLKKKSTDELKENSTTPKHKNGHVMNEDQTKVTPKKQSAKKNTSASNVKEKQSAKKNTTANSVKENSVSQKVKKRLLSTTISDNEDEDGIANETIHTCDVCEFNTTSMKKLTKHVQEQHNENVLLFDMQNKVKKAHLKDTMHDSTLNDDDEDAYEVQNNKRKHLQCNMCDFTTTTVKKLTKHSKQHLDTDQASNAINSTPKQLNNERKHEKSMAFNNLSKISADDIETTSNERNNTCLICGKKFVDMENLRSHMTKAHLSTEKSNTCTNCATNFSNSSKFDAHMLSGRCKKFTQRCKAPQCNRLFESFSKMEKHFNKAHNARESDDDEN